MTRRNSRAAFIIFLLFCFFCFAALAFSEVPSDKNNDDDNDNNDEERCLVDCGSGFDQSLIMGNNQACNYPSIWEGGSQMIPNGCMRSNIFGNVGSGYVVAYPSEGGVVFLKRPHAVDLQHLGLPHLHDAERSPEKSHQGDEDAIATRMVQLGAQWWPHWDLYFKHKTRMDRMAVFYDYHFPSHVHVGYPTTGGLWVANFTREMRSYHHEDLVVDEVDDVDGCWSLLPPEPDRWRTKMGYVLSMDDKCEVMKELGATFYESADDVPGLAKTVEEAKQLFEPFRERLALMDDDKYRNRLCYWNKVVAGEDEEAADTDDKPRWGIWSIFR